MSCFFPMYRVPEEVVHRLLPSRYHSRVRNGGLIIKRIEYDQLVNYIPSSAWQKVPCGMCIGCRQSYSREWAIRCLMEAKYSDQSYFVTLTYDDEHLPVKSFVDLPTGEIYKKPVLQRSDFTLFMKRLRNELPEGLRYYMCGEYGDLFNRPHYHAILFNAPFDDLAPVEASQSGDRQYDSDLLRSTWKNGRVRVSEVNYDTAAYVSGYVNKKTLGPARKQKREIIGLSQEKLKDLGLSDDLLIEGLDDSEPFVGMSRRPGIGRKYFDDRKEFIYQHDKIVMKYHDQIQTLKPPRYYDKIYDVDHHDDLERLKKDRIETAQWIEGQKRRLTSLSPDEQNLVEYELHWQKLHQRKHR